VPENETEAFPCKKEAKDEPNHLYPVHSRQHYQPKKDIEKPEKFSNLSGLHNPKRSAEIPTLSLPSNTDYSEFICYAASTLQ